MATMKDVAKLAGVSTAAVSHVLNSTKQLSPETTRRILEAIKETQYVPHTVAKSLRMGKTLTIGVLVEDIRGLPVADIVNGIAECLEEHGYHMILNDLHMLEKLYNHYEHIIDYRETINSGIGFLLQTQVDGIIYVGLHDRHLDGIIDPIDKPLVYAYSHGANNDHYVTYDNTSGTLAAMNLLIQHGHRDIAVIAGHPNSFPTHRRMEGYRAVMKSNNLPIREEYICYGDWEYTSGYESAKKLLSLPNPPAAIFAMNDLMAAGCLNCARAMGLEIPRDLSIVGFDNREIARYLSVPLTTIKLPTSEIGYQSAKMLLSLQEEENGEQSRIILPCSLVVRDSVGPA